MSWWAGLRWDVAGPLRHGTRLVCTIPGLRWTAGCRARRGTRGHGESWVSWLGLGLRWRWRARDRLIRRRLPPAPYLLGRHRAHGYGAIRILRLGHVPATGLLRGASGVATRRMASSWRIKQGLAVRSRVGEPPKSSSYGGEEDEPTIDGAEKHSQLVPRGQILRGKGGATGKEISTGQATCGNGASPLPGRRRESAGGTCEDRSGWRWVASTHGQFTHGLWTLT